MSLVEGDSRWIVVLRLLFISCQSVDYRYFVTTPGLGPVDTSFWLTPVHANVSSLEFVGGIPNDVSKWYIAEWNIPNQFCLTPHYANTTERIPCNYIDETNTSQLLFWSESINGNICVYKNVESGISEFELITKGINLSCGVEYDLFLSPINDQYEINYPHNIGFIGRGDTAPYLDELSQLNLKFKILMVTDVNVTFHCGSDLCGTPGSIDYGYITVGIILSNLRKKQTIFYQIQLFDTRDNLNCKTGGNACIKQTNWYFRSNPFGVNQNIPLFDNYKCLNYSINKLIDFNENMLETFINIITVESVNANIVGIDHNISNWQIGGIYLGQGIQGMTDMDIMITNIDLIGVLKID